MSACLSVTRISLDELNSGSMVHKAGAGPKPIPHKELSIEKLRDAIKFAVGPSAKKAAAALADKIRNEVWFSVP